MTPIEEILARLASDEAVTREDGLLAIEELDEPPAELAAPLGRIAADPEELVALRAGAARILLGVDARAALELLQEFVSCDQPGLRWRGRNILGMVLADEALVKEIFRHGVEDPDLEARLQAAYELHQREPEFDPVPVLAEVLASGEPGLRIEALKVLTILPPGASARELVVRVQAGDADSGVQAFAQMALMMWGEADPGA